MLVYLLIFSINFLYFHVHLSAFIILSSKMVLQMTATVLCSSVFVLFLFVFPVFCFSKMISFTRDELLNIRQNTLQCFAGHCSWRSRSAGQTLQDVQTGEAGRRAREASSARIKNAVA